MKTAAQFKTQLDRISKLVEGLAEAAEHFEGSDDPVAEFHALATQARGLLAKLRDIEQRLRDRSDAQAVFADELETVTAALDIAADYLEALEADDEDDG